MDALELYVDRNVTKLYDKIREHYEIVQDLEHQVKASISVDFVLFITEFILASPRILEPLLEKLIVIPENLFSDNKLYSVPEFVPTRKEAAKILTEHVKNEGLSFEEIRKNEEVLVNTKFESRIMINWLFDHRRKEYFSQERKSDFVISPLVPLLITRAGLEPSQHLIEDIQQIFVNSLGSLTDLLETYKDLGLKTPNTSTRRLDLIQSQEIKETVNVRQINQSEFKEKVVKPSAVPNNHIEKTAGASKDEWQNETAKEFLRHYKVPKLIFGSVMFLGKFVGFWGNLLIALWLLTILS